MPFYYIVTEDEIHELTLYSMLTTCLHVYRVSGEEALLYSIKGNVYVTNDKNPLAQLRGYLISCKDNQ